MIGSEPFRYEIGWSPPGGIASPLTEAEEVELAMELLTVSTEAEMDQFLGNMFKGVWKGIKKVGSAVGKIARPLGGILKAVAKKALPFVGGALGSLIPIPGVGTAVGSALGGALSKALELEYAELDREEAEFEMARRFVRIAATAAQRAALAPATVDVERAVNEALVAAARKHIASADLSELEVFTQGAGASRHSGRWVRQGESIVLIGV
jgi:uncharacterized protein (DUF697 family)